MRFISIKAVNYRQHKELDFSFPRVNPGGHDLNVILGSNTFGKTNLANAVCWCLWNCEPDMAMTDDERRKNEGKPRLNDAVRKDAVERGIATVPVSVALKISLNDNDSETLHVARRCIFAVNEKTVLEHPSEVTVMHVKRSGSSETMMGEDAAECINSYFPQDIRSYIIFDGEQLTRFFDSKRATMVKTAMLSLSGVYRLSIAIEHHRKRLEALDKKVVGNNAELSACEEELKNASELVRDTVAKIEMQESNVADFDSKISELEEFLGRHKGVDELQEAKKKYEAEQAVVESELCENEQAKYELIREYYPLLKILPFAIRVKEFIDEKRARKELPPPLKKDVLEEILRVGACSVCGTALSEKAEKEIREKLTLYSSNVVSPETSDVLMGLLEPQILSMIANAKTYQRNRDLILRRGVELMRRERELGSKIAEIEEKLGKVSDTQRYRDSCVQLKLSKDARDNSMAELLFCKKELPALRSKEADAKVAYERAYKRNVQDEHLRAMHAILEGSCELVAKTQAKSIEKIRASIEKSANAYYQQLKNETANEFGEVSFDLNFNVSLKEGGRAAQATMSAAERALVALSVTLALHDEAGMNFPLIIDTPVANMDSGHRRNFATTLKKLSESKQLTLLFTDTEYVNDIPAVFDGSVNEIKSLVKANGVSELK